jgi:cellobiose phosphorylase
VDPCIPAAWKEVNVTRRFRNATYAIRVLNPDGKCRGVKSMTLDGETMQGNLLPVYSDNKTHHVQVTLE